MDISRSVKINSYLDWAFKGRSAWWLYVIGVILLYLNVKFLKDIIDLPLTIFVGPLVIGSPAGHLIVQHFGFIFVFLAALLVVWLLHKRPGWSVALPQRKFEGWNMGMGFLFSGLTLLGTYSLYALIGGAKLSFASPDLKTYLSFLAAGIFVFLLQTSSEELTLRLLHAGFPPFYCQSGDPYCIDRFSLRCAAFAQPGGNEITLVCRCALLV